MDDIKTNNKTIKLKMKRVVHFVQASTFYVVIVSKKTDKFKKLYKHTQIKKNILKFCTLTKMSTRFKSYIVTIFFC